MKQLTVHDLYAQDTFEDVLAKVHSRLTGLTHEEVLTRQKAYGLNVIHKRHTNFFSILSRQVLGNPLILILVVATTVSYFLGQHISAYYIFVMLLVSIALGTWNDYAATRTVDKLLKKISPTAVVLRNDLREEIPIRELTVGDIVLVARGAIIPADLRMVDTTHLSVNEAALTGESEAVMKNVEVSADHPTQTIAFMGTSVENGYGKGVVVRIGKDTEFGKIAKSTIFIKPQTEFEKGLAGFGSLLVKVIFALTIGIFVINALLGHKVLDSLLFSLAIAVGLTPELLPVIVTVSLSHGAGKLAKKKVVAKQLIAIENLGNMDILCTDKTGTLTEGQLELVDYFDANEKQDPDVLRAAMECNDAIVHRHIVGDAVDAAIWRYSTKHSIHLDHPVEKLHDEPFDFEKRMMFCVLSGDKTQTLVVKGAPDSLLAMCHSKTHKAALKKRFDALNADGLRVIALASRPIAKKKSYTWGDADGLTFVGYLTFLDVPKLSAKEAIDNLKRLGVAVKIITGDNEIVTRKVCTEVDITLQGLLLGSDMEKLSDEELREAVEKHNVFASVNPEQKLHIIEALRKNGHAVGYLGDGINDIPSLRSADVGISVNTAVDVAKDAATIVLLRKSLDVIAEGITEGRRTFNNTIKYILMGTSSNFGNMFSAAGASFFLPFLPMTPVQILLTNGLYDMSQLSIPSDNVDAESLVKPRHWDIKFIRNYMIFFGPISSLYDFMTYGVMLFVFHASPALFQTGWFIESMATEILVVFVIRTSRSPFFFSRPGKWLTLTCLSLVGISALIPFSPLAPSLGFVTPPPLYFVILIFMVGTYLLLVELLKHVFLRKYTL